jgi:hypothetical protein
MRSSSSRLLPSQITTEPRYRRDTRVSDAPQLLLQTVVAEAKFRRAGREFLAAARGIDQRRIVRSAAGLIAERCPSAPIDRALDVAWKDAERLFGWVDVDELEPQGRA